MLSCRDVAGVASDYINRDLTLRQRLAVRFHLGMCRFCNRYIRQMRRTVAFLRRFGRAEASRGAEDAARVEDAARDLFRSTRQS